MEAVSTIMASETIEADATASRARNGDLDAFESLYRAHVGRILALCLRMTGDRERAEELTQETFVRAWEKLSTFRFESGFATWLRRVAVNVVLSEQRGRGRRRWKEATPPQEPAPPTGEPATSAIDLERAIAALPTRARHVFVLHDVEGRGHDEIAGLLEVTTGTTKAQLHRARRLLREALQR